MRFYQAYIEVKLGRFTPLTSHIGKGTAVAIADNMCTAVLPSASFAVDVWVVGVND